MSARLLLVVLLLLLFAAFVTVNWAAFTAPTQLSLLAGSVEAPLGLVLLAVLGAVAAFFIGYMAWWQGRVLRETRRHKQELQAQRELADQAEASRFTALQAAMQAEFAQLAGQTANVQAELAARLDTAMAALRTEFRQTGDGLAAHIAEVEDRLEAQAGLRPPAGG